jgi:selenocysteine lyase/cysteine desulfurase
MDHIAARNTELAERLRRSLTELPGVTVQDKGIVLSAIVTFTVDGHDPAAIQRHLRRRSINVSTSSQSSARLDFPRRGLDQVVRASVHYFNTHAEIDALVAAVADLTAGRAAVGV